MFYEQPVLKFERLLVSYLATAPRGLGQLSAVDAVVADEQAVAGARDRPRAGHSAARLVLRRTTCRTRPARFFPSPFDEAAILTIDGVGEWSTATWGVGRGSRIELAEEMRFPNSLGLLYSAFTYYCGFKINSGEYKLMGLAPYGAAEDTAARFWTSSFSCTTTAACCSTSAISTTSAA